MKYTTAERTTTRQTEHTAQQGAAAGPDGFAKAPPAYGIDFVDRGLTDTAPVQRRTAASKQLLK